MKLASKEADETDYWLALCKFSKGYPDTDYLIDKLNELTRKLAFSNYSIDINSSTSSVPSTSSFTRPTSGA
jgi:hypothetical protein